MILKTKLLGHVYEFKSVKDALAKANEEKSGDRLAGIAAENAEERVAAKVVVANLTLADLRNNPAVPYEEDEVTRLNQDSMAYDADSGDGTVYEHNYSRMNEGGCVMFCLEEAIHNTFRGNVSYDDLGGTISPSQNPDARIEENTFYVRNGVPFVRPHMGGGSYTERDNTVIPLPEKE